MTQVLTPHEIATFSIWQKDEPPKIRLGHPNWPHIIRRLIDSHEELRRQLATSEHHKESYRLAWLRHLETARSPSPGRIISFEPEVHCCSDYYCHAKDDRCICAKEYQLKGGVIRPGSIIPWSDNCPEHGLK